MHQINKQKIKTGFTLIELIVVMGIFAVLSAFISVSLLKGQTGAAVDSTLEVLKADIKSQQTKAMLGGSAYGIFFSSTGYVLFQGSSYVPNLSSNFSIEFDQGVSFTTINLPSSQIVFDSLSGEVNGYSSSQNSVVLTHDSAENFKTLSISSFGVITEN